MQRVGFPTIVIAFLSTLAAGCFGGGVMYMTECESSLPLCDYYYSKENWGPAASAQTKDRPIMLTALPAKEEFLAEWGVPSETITVSEDEVTFVYKTANIWCGAVVAYVFPVPLVSPSCEGFDRITFKGSKATHIHFKRKNEVGIGGGFVGGGAVGAASKGKSCPIPCREVAPSVWTDAPGK